MKKAFSFGSIISLSLYLAILICICSCKGPNVLTTALNNVVEIRYDHVANIKAIAIDNCTVTSHDADGFWAIFVICSIDVQGKEVQTFEYNTSNFSVEYGSESFGLPLLPNTARCNSTLLDATNTPRTANEIVRTIQVGRSKQNFPRGFYPSLNYRIAILIPRKLRLYQGEELKLVYNAPPTVVIGGNNRPGEQYFNYNPPLPTMCRQPMQQ